MTKLELQDSICSGQLCYINIHFSEQQTSTYCLVICLGKGISNRKPMIEGSHSHYSSFFLHSK